MRFSGRRIVTSPMMFAGAGGGSAFTWNPADASAHITLANSNRDLSYSTSAGYACVRSTGFKTSGQWYVEVTVISITSAAKDWGLGIGDSNFTLTNYLGGTATGCMYYFANASTYTSGSGLANPASLGTIVPVVSDVYALAIDIDTKKMWMAKNNVWVTGNPAVGTETAPWITWTTAFNVYVAGLQSDTNTGYTTVRLAATNTYTPPTGYSVLNA